MYSSLTISKIDLKHLLIVKSKNTQVYHNNIQVLKTFKILQHTLFVSSSLETRRYDFVISVGRKQSRKLCPFHHHPAPERRMTNKDLTPAVTHLATPLY